MKTCSLAHLGDHELRRALAASFSQEDGATATVLAHIAEFDARRLYLPAGYPSMFGLCGAAHSANYAEIGTMRSSPPKIRPSAFCLMACPGRPLPFTPHSSDAPSGLSGRKGALHDGSTLLDARRLDRGV